MSNMPDLTLLDSAVYAPRCRLQRLFSPRSISMYESAPTRDSEPCLPRPRSNQSFNAYKRLPSPASNTLKLGSFKPYICGRPLSPSFLDLTPSPGYDSSEHHPPLATCVSSTVSTSCIKVTRKLPPLPGCDLPSEYHPPLATCVSTTSTSRIKVKRKPPPLILTDSFHSAGPQSPVLALALNDPQPALLTPSTPFSPISPRYRMPSEKEQFRRRLLKLQRTLGEQITPGLINRPKPCSEATAGTPDSSTRPHKRLDTSLNSTSGHLPTARFSLCGPIDRDLLDLKSHFLRNQPLTHRRKSSAPVPSSPTVYSQRHFLPETVTLTPMTLTAFTGPVIPKSTTPAGPSLEFVLNCDVQDSSSEDDEYDSPPVSPFDDSYPPSPSLSDYDDEDGILVDTLCLTLDQNGFPVETPTTPGVRRRDRRNGWSGEWNQPHIQDVITKLRSL